MEGINKVRSCTGETKKRKHVCTCSMIFKFDDLSCGCEEELTEDKDSQSLKTVNSAYGYFAQKLKHANNLKTIKSGK